MNDNQTPGESSHSSQVETSSNVIDEATLQSVIGRKTPVIDMKVVDHLDATALDWLSASNVGLMTFANDEGIFVTVARAADILASERRIELHTKTPIALTNCELERQ